MPKTSQPLNVAIVGLGHLHPRSYMPLFKAVPQTRVTAVVEPDEKLREPFARDFALKAYADVDAMLAAEKIDIAAVFLPHADCPAAAAKLAKRGIHLMVEKPMASSAAGAGAIVKAAKAAGVKTTTGYCWRLHPGAAEFKRLIESGALGQIVAGEGRCAAGRLTRYIQGNSPWMLQKSRSGGGPMFNLGVHWIDLFRWMLSDEVVEVSGQNVKINKEYDIEDNSLAHLRFKSGPIVALDISYTVPDSFPHGRDLYLSVRGTKGVGNIKDPKAFMAATKAAKKVLADNGVTGTGLPAMGTQVLMSVINEVGGLPTRNHQDNQFEGAKDIGAEAMATPRKTDGKKHLVTNQACFGCTIACGRISKMDEGHFTIENKPQYRGANGGLEYEAAWALGAANGVNDLECLQYANLLCNEEGIDPISFGATVGAVMELYGMGVLTKEQIGIEAPFGSARALAFLAEETVNGRGFGKEIGQGSKRLTAKYGHPELSMSSKGQEFPAYDGRAIQGIGLAYATSNRGGCHLRGYTIASEILGIPVKTDPLESQGKPELVKAFQDATAAFDSSGLCIFTTFAWGLQDLSPQMQGACGEQYTIEELAKIGERIWNMEREFNNRAGFTKADDSLPARLTTAAEACKTGPAKGKFNELATMLPLYYEARGWDSEGRPTAETRERLSL